MEACEYDPSQRVCPRHPVESVVEHAGGEGGELGHACGVAHLVHEVEDTHARGEGEGPAEQLHELNKKECKRLSLVYICINNCQESAIDTQRTGLL